MAETGGDRGEAYAAGFAALQRDGMDIHGEATLVASLAPPGARILDAGCGTGRVAIELARRRYVVTGADLDESMLAVARREAPDLDWRRADLATMQLDSTYDLAVLAGNVMIFVTPDTEGAVLTSVAAHLRPGGLLVAGFQVIPDHLSLGAYDRLAADAGLGLRDRWATWDRAPYTNGDYAVSVHVHNG